METKMETKVEEAKPVTPVAPITKRMDHWVYIGINHTVKDPYFWLRDDERKNPEVMAHLEAENKYVDEIMAHTQDQQTRLYTEYISHLKEDDRDVPFQWGDYLYSRRMI